MRAKTTIKILFLLFFTLTNYLNCNCQERDDRKLWIGDMLQIANPVLENIANNTLREQMPIYRANKGDQYLTAFGLVIDGVAPWLELGPDSTTEGQLRKRTLDITLKAIKNSFDPKSKDYMLFSQGKKRVVLLAYFAQGLLRAPNQIWKNLDEITKKRIIVELISTREIKPPENNWLLFASIIEAAILEFDGKCDDERLLYGIDRFMNDFYLGDSMYGDGADYAYNYYNSYVIHPMLTESMKIAVEHSLYNDSDYKIQIARLKRFTEIQERSISSTGEFAPNGRTLVCRMGAFHALSQASLMGYLSPHLTPGQVRSAMTAVLNTTLKNPANFSDEGFLNVGFAGKQYDFADPYVSGGTAYHCLTFFTALGLKPSNKFWTQPYTEWTSLKAYSGKEFLADHSLKDGGRNQIVNNSFGNLKFNFDKTYLVLFYSAFILFSAFIFYAGYKIGKENLRLKELKKFKMSLLFPK